MYFFRLKKIFLSVLFLCSVNFFNANALEENSTKTNEQTSSNDKQISQYDYKIATDTKEQKQTSGFKKRSFTITPYFDLSFIKQNFKYSGKLKTDGQDDMDMSRQQINLGISFDSYYNFNEMFAMSAGLGISTASLFAFSSQGTDYYFNINEYKWVDDNYWGLGRYKKTVKSNFYTVTPLFELTVPIRFKIRLNSHISLEPYAFAGINLSKICNQYWDSTTSYETKEKTSYNVGLSAGGGLNFMFFEERVVIGAEYKYLENRKYKIKFMVNTFSLKFAYRFHVF